MKAAQCVIRDVTPYLCQTPVKQKVEKHLCRILSNQALLNVAPAQKRDKKELQELPWGSRLRTCMVHDI